MRPVIMKTRLIGAAILFAATGVAFAQGDNWYQQQQLELQREQQQQQRELQQEQLELQREQLRQVEEINQQIREQADEARREDWDRSLRCIEAKAAGRWRGSC